MSGGQTNRERSQTTTRASDIPREGGAAAVKLAAEEAVQVVIVAMEADEATVAGAATAVGAAAERVVAMAVRWEAEAGLSLATRR